MYSFRSKRPRKSLHTWIIPFVDHIIRKLVDQRSFFGARKSMDAFQYGRYKENILAIHGYASRWTGWPTILVLGFSSCVREVNCVWYIRGEYMCLWPLEWDDFCMILRSWTLTTFEVTRLSCAVIHECHSISDLLWFTFKHFTHRWLASSVLALQVPSLHPK